MPEAFELWDLMDDRVREVHLYARVKLQFEFRVKTFQTFFFNLRRFQIPFLGRRALNASVKFLDVVRVTQHVGSRFDYTPNIFVQCWVVNLTDTITANVSTITWCTYDAFSPFYGFFLWSNHERLRLKQIELKLICLDELLDRIRQDVRDNVAANVCAPVNNALGGAFSNDSDSDDVWLNIYDSN